MPITDTVKSNWIHTALAIQHHHRIDKLEGVVVVPCGANSQEQAVEKRVQTEKHDRDLRNDSRTHPSSTAHTGPGASPHVADPVVR